MRDTLVLCYHGVSDDWASQLSVRPEELERQLAWLLRRGYSGSTFTEAVERAPSDRALAVTFDDSFRSVIELARPVLRELGLPGTVFVPTAFAGEDRPMEWSGIGNWLGGAHERELLPMSWEELGELAEEGWEIGSHTRTHPRLPTLDAPALRDELAESRAECEARLGTCRSIAYPYGDYSERVVEATAAAGYAVAGAMAGRAPDPGPLAWPRVPIFLADGDARFRLKVSPSTRWLRTTPVWRARLAMRREPS